MAVNLIDHMPFARELGLNVTSAEPTEVVATVEVTESLCTTGRIMHGGAIMAVADTLGAICGSGRNGSLMFGIASPQWSSPARTRLGSVEVSQSGWK